MCLPSPCPSWGPLGLTAKPAPSPLFLGGLQAALSLWGSGPPAPLPITCCSPQLPGRRRIWRGERAFVPQVGLVLEVARKENKGRPRPPSPCLGFPRIPALLWPRHRPVPSLPQLQDDPGSRHLDTAGFPRGVPSNEAWPPVSVATVAPLGRVPRLTKGAVLPAVLALWHVLGESPGPFSLCPRESGVWRWRLRTLE